MRLHAYTWMTFCTPRDAPSTDIWNSWTRFLTPQESRNASKHHKKQVFDTEHWVCGFQLNNERLQGQNNGTEYTGWEFQKMLASWESLQSPQQLKIQWFNHLLNAFRPHLPKNFLQKSYKQLLWSQTWLLTPVGHLCPLHNSAFNNQACTIGANIKHWYFQTEVNNQLGIKQRKQ